MNDNVTLRVNGREWNGWTSVRIGAGIDTHPGFVPVIPLKVPVQ